MVDVVNTVETRVTYRDETRDGFKRLRDELETIKKELRAVSQESTRATAAASSTAQAAASGGNTRGGLSNLLEQIRKARSAVAEFDTVGDAVQAGFSRARDAAGDLVTNGIGKVAGAYERAREAGGKFGSSIKGILTLARGFNPLSLAITGITKGAEYASQLFEGLSLTDLGPLGEELERKNRILDALGDKANQTGKAMVASLVTSFTGASANSGPSFLERMADGVQNLFDRVELITGSGTMETLYRTLADLEQQVKDTGDGFFTFDPFGGGDGFIVTRTEAIARARGEIEKLRVEQRRARDEAAAEQRQTWYEKARDDAEKLRDSARETGRDVTAEIERIRDELADSGLADGDVRFIQIQLTLDQAAAVQLANDAASIVEGALSPAQRRLQEIDRDLNTLRRAQDQSAGTTNTAAAFDIGSTATTPDVLESTAGDLQGEAARLIREQVSIYQERLQLETEFGDDLSAERQRQLDDLQRQIDEYNTRIEQAMEQQATVSRRLQQVTSSDQIAQDQNATLEQLARERAEVLKTIEREQTQQQSRAEERAAQQAATQLRQQAAEQRREEVHAERIIDIRERRAERLKKQAEQEAKRRAEEIERAAELRERALRLEATGEVDTSGVSSIAEARGRIDDAVQKDVEVVVRAILDQESMDEAEAALSRIEEITGKDSAATVRAVLDAESFEAAQQALAGVSDEDLLIVMRAVSENTSLADASDEIKNRAREIEDETVIDLKVRARVEALENFQTVLSTVQDVVGGFADVAEQRGDIAARRRADEIKLVQEELLQAQKDGDEEAVRSAQERLDSLTRIDAQQRARDEARVKRYARLQAAIAFASAVAGAAQTLADPTNLNPFTKLAAYGTVLTAGLTAYQTLKGLNIDNAGGASSLSAGAGGAASGATGTSLGSQTTADSNNQSNAAPVTQIVRFIIESDGDDVPFAALDEAGARIRRLREQNADVDLIFRSTA